MTHFKWRDRVIVVAILALLPMLAAADPYPPRWTGTNPDPANGLHFKVAPWPSDASFEAIPFTQNGNPVDDPRTQDPSNGGTRPQNFANISSGCTDQSRPSTSWYFDPANGGTIFFRWRVEQIANT